MEEEKFTIVGIEGARDHDDVTYGCVALRRGDKIMNSMTKLWCDLEHFEECVEDGGIARIEPHPPIGGMFGDAIEKRLDCMVLRTRTSDVVSSVIFGAIESNLDCWQDDVNNWRYYLFANFDSLKTTMRRMSGRLMQLREMTVDDAERERMWSAACIFDPSLVTKEWHERRLESTKKKGT